MRDLLKDKAICEAATPGTWAEVHFIADARKIASHAIDRAIAAEKENAELRQRIAELEEQLKPKHPLTRAFENLEKHQTSTDELCLRCKVRPKAHEKLRLCTPCFTSNV